MIKPVYFFLYYAKEIVAYNRIVLEVDLVEFYTHLKKKHISSRLNLNCTPSAKI